MNAHTKPALIDAMSFHRKNIEAALAHADGDHTIDDVFGRVLTGKALFFANEDAFAICEEIRFTRKKVLHVWLAGGTLEGVLALTGQAEDVARQLDCDRLTLTGRKGFARALTDEGWKQVHVTMERSLSPTIGERSCLAPSSDERADTASGA